MIVDSACNPDQRVRKEAEAVGAAGLDVTVLAWDRTCSLPEVEVHRSYRLRRLRIRSRDQRRFGQLAPLARFWLRAMAHGVMDGYDIVHCHDFPCLPAAWLLTRLPRKVLLYDAHEIYWLMESHKYGAFALRTLKVLELALVRAAAHIITVSTPLADYFNQVHPHVSIVGNWYDPVALNVSRSYARQVIGVPDTAFCLACVGTLGPTRLEPLLIAVAERYPDISVVLAGRTEDERQLRKAAARLPNLKYLGWLPDPSIAYAACDALFYGLAPGHPYGAVSSPNTLFLAIALGLPLIAHAAGEAGQVVGKHGMGCVFSEASAESVGRCIAELREPSRMAAARMAAVALQKEFSWGRAERVLLEAYRAVTT